jgi:hypothetical protein
MCSPKPPSAPKVNPYEGLSTDPRFEAARQELGIDEVDREWEVTKINEYIQKQDVERASRDPNFNPARDQLLNEGVLKADDPLDAWYLSQVQDRMYTNTQDEAYAQQKADTDKAAQDFKDMMSAQSEAQAKMMEEIMNAPTYQARQGDVAPVMAPVVNPKPIPVAPPTPTMEIQETPPAPELTQTTNNMAIVRQPKTARARQRTRSRGTASLST